ncbi:MAG TPA: Hsp20/alpha crystallin family protein, partial [Candidatus Acidoferrales bacterium]|nr:Hsp20/alpha crystallin family protein [Candidatus Acidoferrales bacterium]
MAEKAAGTKTALETLPTPITITGPRGIFERLDRIYNDIARRAFEIFEGNGGALGHELDNWFAAEAELLHPVKISISETEDALTVQAEVPGFSEKDLEIRVEPTQLTITGKRETTAKWEKAKTLYQEYRSDEILRVVDLPAEVDNERVTTTLKNGMLEFQMPKATKATTGAGA